MSGTIRRSDAMRLAVGLVLLLALVASGCTRKPVAPVSTAVTTPTSSVAASSASGAGAVDSRRASGDVDAAGGAVGAPLTVGSASKGAKGTGIPRPSKAAATHAAVTQLQESEDIGAVKSVSARSMTQDKKGEWWVLIDVADEVSGSNQAVLTYNGKKWEVVVFGEGISDDDLPPDVRF